MPRQVKTATCLAFGLNGILILTARYRLSYDAYNHMFFADHYLRDWWSLWETRWYTGFEIVSYPPLIHQLMALLGHIIGVDAAYGLILWATLTAYPLAIFYFACIFVGKTAARYAAFGAALLPSLYLTAHVFGQLPTLVATLLALFGGAILADFLDHGGALTGTLAVFIFATVVAAHHATLLFIPWLIAAVAIQKIFRREGQNNPLNAEKQGFIFDFRKKLRFFRIDPHPFFRLAVFTVFAIFAGWLVILPFWQWGAGQTIQTTIDHISRHNFFHDPFAALLFFLPMYGLLIPLIPFAFWMGMRQRVWGLGLAFLFLFLLGLGDTTPLPRLLFGSGWAWLTYDRFSFWASLLLLVLLGLMMVKVHQMFLDPKNPRFLGLWGKWEKPMRRAFFISMTFIALLISLIPTWLPTQPPQLDMRPIVDFLAQGDHALYRYLTFGFGDQLAYLSRLTDATTIDGSYHTARTLPELRASGIGQIDTAFWLPGGLARLDPILQKSGERGVRWGFVNLKFYNPVLLHNGWQFVTTLSNGVTVWENPAGMFPPPVQPPSEPPFTTFAWGVFPLLAFFATGALALRRYRPTLGERVFAGIQFIATGLLPFSLTFWAFRRLFVIPHERVYFTYSDALFFLSDGLALVAVLAWAIPKFPNPDKTKMDGRISKIKFAQLASWFHSRSRHLLLQERFWLLVLCILASLSVFWSLDWRTSLYIALHLWLAFGLYLSLSETPGMWRPFALGSVAALVLQAIVGIWQFIGQSTAFTMALNLDWPGNLVPALSGSSVVQLADGSRILRAYGTLPHPNLLGGWTVILLAYILTLILIPSKRQNPLLVVFAAGLTLLVLTFSRGAWLGFVALSVVILFRWKQFDRKALVGVAIVGVICLVLLVASLQNMFVTRLTNSQVQTEQVSNFTRAWLIERTWEIIQQEPLLGVGIGSYSLALSRHVANFYDIEPVHNIPLLAWSELGPGGLVALAGIAISVVVRSFKARGRRAIIFSAALAGLLIISLFDHYLWTLAPGRLLFASTLGLWAGQVSDEFDC